MSLWYRLGKESPVNTALKKCPFAGDNTDRIFCRYYLNFCDQIQTCSYKRKLAEVDK